jgi:transcriptional regulator with XRE-family HTH domain
MITGDQLRMARAALRLTVKDTAELAGIDKGTIVRIEAGEKAYRLTLLRLQEVLEARGVLFLEQEEGVSGRGVRFKWGIETATTRTQGRSADGGDGGSLKALDPESAAHWAAKPEAWFRLSEISRAVLSREMFGDAEAADAIFRQS